MGGKGPFRVGGSILWRLIPFSILWSFRKDINDMIFKGESKTDDFIFSISLRMAKWASFRKELKHLSMNNILL